MTRRSPKAIVVAHLNDILSAIVYMQNFVSGMTLEEFISDKEVIYAVSRCFDTIGRKAALIKSLYRQNRDFSIPSLPYMEMIGAAHYLNHPYREVNPEILWNSIERDIEKLEGAVRQALGDAISSSTPKRVFKYPKIKLISVDRDFVLTQDALSHTIVPFVDALQETQRVIDLICNKPPSIIKIQTISQNSPVGIALEGVADAIKLFIDVVVPWRREHAKQMAKYEEQLKLLQIEKDRAEVLETRARIQRERSELEKIGAEITEKRISLALKVLENLPGDYSEVQRHYYINQLLEPLGVLTSAPLLIEIPHQPRE